MYVRGRAVQWFTYDITFCSAIDGVASSFRGDNEPNWLMMAALGPLGTCTKFFLVTLL